MFNERFKPSDRDSLDDESMLQQQQILSDREDYQDNNYEFLYDEDYQKVKNNVQSLKWQLLGENLCYHLSLKECLTIFDELNELINRKNISKLSNYREERTYENNLTEDSLAPPKVKLTNSISLNKQIKVQAELFKTRITELINNEKDLCKILKKEREKSEFLERDIEELRHYSKNSEEGEFNQESYIEEIETQLQETRVTLLEKKLQITDKDQELMTLKKQLKQFEQNYTQLEQEKKELDTLIIRVSQDLKSKDYDSKDLSYQLTLDKDQLMKQLDSLKKELLEEKGKYNTLENVESNLLHKLQTNEQEVQDCKSYIMEIEEKLELKSDSIEKAQKVIQKLNEELEKRTDQNTKIEKEKETLLRETKEMNKKVVELNKQIQTNINQHYMTSAQVNSQLKTEIEELKEVLKQYQQEFEQEKRQLIDKIRALNEQNYQIQIDREKQEQHYLNEKQSIQEQLLSKEDIIAKLEQKNNDLQNRMNEEQKELKQQMEMKEHQAQSNILYLQKRIKDLQQENYKQQGYKNDNKITNIGYMVAVKQEFEKVTNEYLDLKKMIKKECIDKLGLQNKFKIFEDFQQGVMNQIYLWDVKTQELVEFANKNQNEFEEQRLIFQKLKQIIKEKDQLIYKQQTQLQQSQQASKIHVGTVKKELERSHNLMQGDLLYLLKLLEQDCKKQTCENYDMDKRFQNFKFEFAQVLEDRENVKNDKLKISGLLEITKRELSMNIQEFLDYKEKLRVMLDIRKTGSQGHTMIFNELENTLDELRVRKDEVLNYKSQIDQLQSQSREEQEFLQKRLMSVENQLENIQRQSMSKEEEQQVLFLQKETKYLNEIQKLQADCNSFSNEVMVRERQLKKIQDQQNQAYKEIDLLQSEIKIVVNKNEQLEEKESKMNNELQCIQESLEQCQQELDEKVQSVEFMESQLDNIEQRCEALNQKLIKQEEELKNEKDLNIILKNEKQQLTYQRENAIDKIRILERENQDVYNELRHQEEVIKRLQQEFDLSEREKLDLQQEFEQMNQIINVAQEEVQNSQQQIEQLTQQLEESKEKEYELSNLRYEIRILKINESKLYEQIGDLRNLLNPQKSEMEIQTDESCMIDVIYLSEEISKQKNQNKYIHKEVEQLREVLSKQNNQIDRLINEKRDLEEYIDQQNQTLKQIKQKQSSNENSNIMNNSTQIMSNNMFNSQELYNQILQEKENYINRLEQEIGEMRKENDQLRDKLIIHEIGTLSFDNMEQSFVTKSKRTNSNKYNSLNESQNGLRGNQTINKSMQY